LTLQLSDARQVSTGYTAIFNNVGANTFSVLDASGGTVMAPASGAAWILVLSDNSTSAGTWRALQLGAGTSVANAAALAGNGLKAITTTLNERIFINAQGSNYSILTTDRANCVEWTGGAGGTFTLPTAGTAGSDWFCYIKNSGTGVLTVQPPAGTIDGTTNKTFNPNDSCIVVCDGSNYFTMGFGQAVASSFNFVTISLAGASGTVILTGAQLNRISYKFTGLLAGNTVVQVPASIQQYWIDNETTGAFTLTISAGGAGTTFVVPQANRTILYCDGLNIVNAITGGGVTFGDGTAAAPSITFASDTTLGLYKAGVDVLGISTAGVQRGVINASGQWVINAPASGVALSVTQVAGGASAAVTLSTVVNTTYLSAGDGTSTFIHAEDASHNHTLGTSTAHSLILLSNNATRITVNSTGNITVAAPTSGTALTVNALANARAFDISDGTQTFDISTDASHNYYVGPIGAVALNLQTGGLATVRVAIGSTGNVTINAPSSGVAVTVNGVASNTAALALDSGAATSNQLITFAASGNTSGKWGIGMSSTPGFVITDVLAGTTRLTLSLAGNFTLNAPSSGRTLAVTGLSGQYATSVQSGGTASQAFGVLVQAGTNSSDNAFFVLDTTGTKNYFLVRGDGVVFGNDGTSLFELGYKDIPQVIQNSSASFALSDRGKGWYTTTNGVTYTVPANASVAFPIGTVIVVTNDSGGNIFIAITTDTLVWMQGGSTATGTRTIALGSVVTLQKVAATRWTISGNGIS